MIFKNIFDYNEQARTQHILKVAESLPKGTRVLDAGAGPCRYREMFAHCEYLSQDFAQFHGEEHSYGKLDYVGDITNIAAENESFDFILCTEVFEHIPRPDLAVAEFSRLLRKGGKLLITAPFAAGIHMAPYHYYGGFSPYWYKHFLPESGLAVDEIISNGGFFKLYGQETRRFLTLLTPVGVIKRRLFLPVKAILALWFRIFVPVVCHYLDSLDRDRSFTAGYFVQAHKE